MRYAVRTPLGFGLIVFAWVALAYTLFQLLQIGTCASGGPYEIAQECPSGTGLLGLMIPGSLLILGIGVGVYAGRGKAPGSDNPPRNEWIAVFIWTGIFWSIAVGCFLGVWGPDADPGPGGKLGGLIVGFLFVPMGAMGLLVLGQGRAKKAGLVGSAVPGQIRDSMPSRPDKGRATRPAPGGEGPVDRLERLTRLRNEGSLTEDEFRELKRKILKDT